MKKIVLFCCCALLFSAPAFARERILNMDVRAVVSPDSTLTVTERIDFVAEGVEIRRGLIRSIPVVRRRGVRRVRSDFSLLSATLDGQPVPCELRREGDEVQVHLGDDSYLKYGEHTYVLVYSMTRQLTFHAEWDELYWNVTGSRWRFSIEAASFAFVPPPGAAVFDVGAWTGPPGSREKDWRRASDGRLETVRALRPGEGFTVSAVWPKGFVVPPPEPLLWRFLNRWKGVLFALTALALIVWYRGWECVLERLPRRGAVIPLFEPPGGRGPNGRRANWAEPARVRYVKLLRFDSVSLLADLIDLAVRGFLFLQPRDRCLNVLKTGKVRGPGLSPPHRALLRRLFEGGRTEVVLGDGPGGGELSVLDLVRGLYDLYPSPPLTRKRSLPLFLAGLLLYVPLVWLFTLQDGFVSGLIGFGEVGAVLLGLVTGGLFLALGIGGLYGTVRACRRSRNPGGEILVWLLLLVAASMILYIWCDIGWVPLWRAASETGFFALAGLLVGLAVPFLSLFTPRRTEEGRALLEPVLGLELYLKTAEKHRLETLCPAVRGRIPEPTPELFERLFPYAIALGVARTWVDAFVPLLEARRYQPEWCTSFGSFDVGHFWASMDSLGESLHSAPTFDDAGGGGWSDSGYGDSGFSDGGGGGGGGSGR